MIFGMDVFVGRRIFLSAPLPMARAISPATKNLMPPNTSCEPLSLVVMFIRL